MSGEADIKISIDRGGTFCDVISQVSGQEPIIFKLLSEDPSNYRDAPTEAIRRTLEIVEGKKISVGDKLDASRIASCRIGTTVATNALLEHKGHRFALVTTQGFRDVCRIGNQTRPKLFTLAPKKAEPLHDVAIEINERVTLEEYDLNPSKKKFTKEELQDPALVKTASGDLVRIIKKPDPEEVRQQFMDLREQGYDNLAISFIHSYIYPEHEQVVADIARKVGFKHILTSHETSPTIKFASRSNSVCSEAYLSPIIQKYVEDFRSGFKVLPKRVDFMCSDGGLKEATRIGGNEALLSGPAGGVVGIVKSCYDEKDGTPLIGFDMGGTSTDVSRFDGAYDYLLETTIADRPITASMLNIATVAAGGGSILSVRHGLLAVGPESAGAHPGPACYRKGGPLTVADANLFLGRLVVSSFPKIFGPNADQPPDTEIIRKKFREIADEFNSQTGLNLTPEEIAQGFLDVANETMSRPIRNATEARGFVPEKHNLVSFGGAGGQHACSIADKLGIKRILIHKWSSLLSAYGISEAELQFETIEPYASKFSKQTMGDVRTRLDELRRKVKHELQSQGAREQSITFDEILVMRYFGSDTNIAISKPDDEDYGAAFAAHHFREFAFNLNRDIIIDSLKVRGVGHVAENAAIPSFLDELASTKTTVRPEEAQATGSQLLYAGSAWQNVNIYHLSHISKGTLVHGPALIIDQTQTIFVDFHFKAYILNSHVVLERSSDQGSNTVHREDVCTTETAQALDPIRLSVFSHRFMSIAEQMGNTLQRTAISTSIKERLDFSCAIFSPTGDLIANAPHVPMQLGSMQKAVKIQHKYWSGKLQPGDALLTNHPHWGGLHLPDLTVVSPMFIGNEIAFYVASRGHHTDIGGKGITAMMPESKELWEEGLNVTTMKIVTDGEFLEDAVRSAFDKAGSYPGCSPTRRIQDNISDIKAKISSNQGGIKLLRKLCEEFGLETVHRYMHGIQANAESAVRSYFKELSSKNGSDGGQLVAEDEYDDGSKIRLRISVDGKTGSAIYDFAGTSPHRWGNYNCPIAITHSAVLYTIRCLVDVDIPLNEGCLNPIDIRLPENCILNPDPSLAVCGCTLASQRVIDTILRAFGRVAASQGCGNSFGWGTGGRDPITGELVPGWNYGESLGGGSGAGPGWHGESAVHVHSTNTRITDVEVIEKRTAVLVRQYSIRHGSGGRGVWRGGNGLVREIEARIPLRFSIMSDSRVRRPYGMNGGGKGAQGMNYVWKYSNEGGKRGPLRRIQIPGKSDNFLQPGERMEIRTPGGGGWGRLVGFSDLDMDDMPDVDQGLV